MSWRGFYKEPRVLIAAFLFAFWFFFNQGKITALGLWGGKPGYMFTEAGWSNSLAGMIVHSFVLLVCIGVSLPLAKLAGWILGKIKA